MGILDDLLQGIDETSKEEKKEEETVEKKEDSLDPNDSEWFCDEFKKYAGQSQSLLQLVALKEGKK